MDNETQIKLRSIGANVGNAIQKALYSHAKGDNELACEWEKIAQDLTYMGRGIARGSWKPEATEAEAKSIYDRWDALNARDESIINA